MSALKTEDEAAKFINYLWQSGSKFKKSNNFGKTAMKYAKRNGLTKIVQTLEYIQWTILYDSFHKTYELITYANEYRPYLSWFLLSYITLDVLRFYSTNTLNVILHSKVFVDKLNCNYVLAEIPFQPPPLLKTSLVQEIFHFKRFCT